MSQFGPIKIPLKYNNGLIHPKVSCNMTIVCLPYHLLSLLSWNMYVPHVTKNPILQVEIRNLFTLCYIVVDVSKIRKCAIQLRPIYCVVATRI